VHDNGYMLLVSNGNVALGRTLWNSKLAKSEEIGGMSQSREECCKKKAAVVEKVGSAITLAEMARTRVSRIDTVNTSQTKSCCRERIKVGQPCRVVDRRRKIT